MRRRHLLRNDVRYLLTVCGILSLLADDSTHELDEMNCPECRAHMIRMGFCTACGSEGLEWGFVGTDFFLGCPGCSQTLIPAVSMDDVARALTDRKWRP